MNFRDDRKPPLSTERSDLYWGTHDTYLERYWQELDEPPSRAAARRASDIAHALDTSLSGLSQAARGGTHPSSPPRPNPEEDQ